MEIRTLRYFIEVAREENMSHAAQRLHVSQSTLSKQLKGLEEELGKKLFTRHSFSIELTAEGMLLRERAADLLAMANKIKAEFRGLDDTMGGDIYFGLAESCQIRYLARTIEKFKKHYPRMNYHILSGDTEQVNEKLDKGILDFSVIVEDPDPVKYNFIEFPETDRWVLVLRENDPLAKKEAITYTDLIDKPLFVSEQSWKKDIPRWCGDNIGTLKLEGTFRLSYNASIFAREGLGYLLVLDGIINTTPGSGLTARPLYPALKTRLYLVWKKQRLLTPLAEQFLDAIKKDFTAGTPVK